MRKTGNLENSEATADDYTGGAEQRVLPGSPSMAITHGGRLNAFHNSLFWCIALLLMLLPVTIQERINRDSRSIDFVYFYSLSRITQTLSADKAYDPIIQKAAFQQVIPDLNRDATYGYSPYPPFVLLLLKPIGHLPFWTAYRCYQAVSAALYLFGLAVLARRFLPNEGFAASTLFPYALAYLPFISNTWLNGQLSVIGFAALAVALAEQRSGRLLRSGVALSCCLYKPTILLFIIPMLLVSKQIRVLLGFLTGACVLVATATVAFGWHIWVAYAHLLGMLGAVERHRQLWHYVDLTAFFSLLLGRPAAVVLAVLGAVIVLPFLAAAWYRGNDRSRTLIWATTISFSLILGPYVPIYDSILLIPSMVATVGSLTINGRSATIPCLSLVFASSWITEAVARMVHIQLLTVVIALLGSLQLISCWRIGGRERYRSV